MFPRNSLPNPVIFHYDRKRTSTTIIQRSPWRRTVQTFFLQWFPPFLPPADFRTEDRGDFYCTLIDESVRKKRGIANFWPFLSRIKAATKERKEPAIFYLLFLQIPAPKTPSPPPSRQGDGGPSKSVSSMHMVVSPKKENERRKIH